MGVLPKVVRRLLDDEIDEEKFIDIISSVYKQDCYIYMQ